MAVQVEIPESVFSLPAGDIPREVLETVAAEGFRSGQLTAAQVRKLLGFETRSEVHQFLADRGIPWVNYSIEDAEREREVWKELLRK